MSLPKLRRLYFPGLISLVLLPMMWICHLISNNTFHKYHGIVVAWIPAVEINKKIKLAGGTATLESFRKYNDLRFIGEPKNDALTQSKLTYLAKQLYFNHDTINGVNISFGDQAKYEDFVGALDVCIRGENKSLKLNFTLMDHSILIYYLGGVQYSNYMIHPYYVWHDQVGINLPQQPSILFETIKNRVLTNSKILLGFWPSILMFVLLLYFSINKKRRYLNLKTFGLVGPSTS